MRHSHLVLHILMNTFHLDSKATMKYNPWMPGKVSENGDLGGDKWDETRSEVDKSGILPKVAATKKETSLC